MPWSPNDPLQKLMAPLVAVLLAVIIDLFVAAMIGGAMPLAYTGRATVYLCLLLYVIVGGCVLFARLAQAEQHKGLSPARVLLWALSLWIWPLLLVRKNKNAPGSH